MTASVVGPGGGLVGPGGGLVGPDVVTVTPAEPPSTTRDGADLGAAHTSREGPLSPAGVRDAGTNAAPTVSRVW